MIGQRIKTARKDKGITQQQLAEMIHRTESSIRKYEKGLIQIPNNVVEQIATVLEVNLADLYGWDELYPEVMGVVKGNEALVKYMNALDYQVKYHSEPCTIPAEQLAPEFRPDDGGDVEGETFTVEIVYEGEVLTITEGEFDELQQAVQQTLEHQLWKIRKQQQK